MRIQYAHLILLADRINRILKCYLSNYCVNEGVKFWSITDMARIDGMVVLRFESIKLIEKVVGDKNLKKMSKIFCETGHGMLLKSVM